MNYRQLFEQILNECGYAPTWARCGSPADRAYYDRDTSNDTSNLKRIKDLYGDIIAEFPEGKLSDIGPNGFMITYPSSGVNVDEVLDTLIKLKNQGIVTRYWICASIYKTVEYIKVEC